MIIDINGQQVEVESVDIEVEPTPITLTPDEVSKEDAIQLLHALEEYDK